MSSRGTIHAASCSAVMVTTSKYNGSVIFVGILIKNSKGDTDTKISLGDSLVFKQR